MEPAYPAMMLVVSIVAEGIILLAYALSGVVPFSIPISILGSPGHRLLYHVVLAAITAAWAWYSWHCWRTRQLPEILCTGAIGTLLLVMQGVTNGHADHDNLSICLMIATCLLTIRIAQRLGYLLLIGLALISLAACSVLFTGSPLLLGIAENLVIVTALVVLTLDWYAGPAEPPLTWVWPWQIGVPRLPTDWPPGYGSGIVWALLCLLIIGLSGAIMNGAVAGPLILASSWYWGYLAWRQDAATWMRILTLVGGFIATWMLLTVVGSLWGRFPEFLVAGFLFSMLMAVVLVWEILGR
jgi:hypothetical protein